MKKQPKRCWSDYSALTLLALGAALILAGCTVADRINYLGGTLHLPLAEQRLLKYQLHQGNDVKEVTLAMHYIGGRMQKVYKAKFSGLDWGGCELQSRDTVVLFTTDKSPTNFMTSGEGYIVHSIWVNEKAQKGDSWDNQEAGTVTVFAGFETISVPAGTYSDCYKTVTEGTPELLDSLRVRHEHKVLNDKQYQKQLAAAKATVVRWFAPRIGLVKEQDGGADYTLELVSMENPGIGKPDTLAQVPPTVIDTGP